MLKGLKILLAISAIMAWALPGFAQKPLKIGFVYVSPIGDAGWTYQHDLGRKAIEDTFGNKVSVSFVENVPEGADAERVIRSLVSKGHELIFTTSFGYMEPTLKVANSNPKVIFEHASGYKTAKNMGNYLPRFYEGRYLAGMVAGSMTKTNSIGYVAAFPIPEVVRGINAFTLGIKRTNPNATVKVIWVNSWFDPGKEREATETLLAQGSDVVTHHTDSTAVVQAANDKGKYAIGYHSDMKAHGPKAHLTAVVHNWEEYYVNAVKSVLNNTWKSKSVWYGIQEGMVSISPINPAVPKSVQDQVKKVEAQIKNGSFHPFSGPIKNQAGKTVLAKGKHLSDKELSGMDYYVQGVEGQLPK